MLTPTAGTTHPRPGPATRSAPIGWAPIGWAGVVALAAALLVGPAAGQTAAGQTAAGQTAEGPVSTAPGVSDPGLVFNLAGGVGSRGVAGLLALGIPIHRGELVLRSGGTTSTQLFGPSESRGDAGLLYGVRKAGSRGWARIAGGAGVVFQESSVPRTGPCDNWLFGCGYDLETQAGVGLLGQVDAVVALHPKFGLGLTLYGGVGRGSGAYGAMGIGLYFGRAGLVASR